MTERAAKRDLTQEEWRVLNRDLARFYLVACAGFFAFGFLFGWVLT